MKANDPKQNPTIQLMDALKIKFTDLPDDAQHTVLEQVGLASDMPTTSSQEQSRQNIQTKLQAMQAGQAQMQPVSEQMHEATEPTPVENQEVAQSGEMELSPEDELLISELSKRGYNEQQIAQAVSMMQRGLPNEQIIQALHGEGVTNG